MPLLDEGAKLVTGDADTSEVGVAVEALHFLTLHSDLPPGILVSILVQITERDVENATTERVGGNL